MISNSIEQCTAVLVLVQLMDSYRYQSATLQPPVVQTTLMQQTRYRDAQ